MSFPQLDCYRTYVPLYLIWQIHNSTFGSTLPHLSASVTLAHTYTFRFWIHLLTLAHTYTFGYTCSHLQICRKLQLLAIIHLLLPHLARNTNVQISNSFKLQTAPDSPHHTIFTAVLTNLTGGREQPPSVFNAAALFIKARATPPPGRFHTP